MIIIPAQKKMAGIWIVLYLKDRVGFFAEDIECNCSISIIMIVLSLKKNSFYADLVVCVANYSTDTNPVKQIEIDTFQIPYFKFNYSIGFKISIMTISLTLFL